MTAKDDERERRLDEVLADLVDAAQNAPQRATEWVVRYPEFAREIDEFMSSYEGVGAGLDGSRDQPPALPAPFGDDFELLEQLGAGGMGVVYRARQKSLDRIVALKMIRAGRLASVEERRRFRTEARAAARLRHPGIVTVFGVGEAQQQQFLCMELIDGQGLERLIQDGPMDPIEAARLVIDVARALHFAHERGVLHRDLKPSNILVDAAGHPHIADFGLARVAGSDADADDTASGTIFGTPAYMPPEQAEGRQAAITAASDVYSLGAVLYELLVGRPPFRGQTQAETLWKVLNAEPVPPRLLRDVIPPELEAICLRALEKDPRRRFATARELADELQRFIEGEPVLTRGVSYPERLWRFYTRSRQSSPRPRRTIARIGLVTGAVAGLLLALAPRLGWWSGIDPSRPEVNTMAGIAALMTIWWVTEAMPLAATALVPLVLFPLGGIMPAAEVSATFTHDIVFLFLGGTLLAIAIEDSGLARRAGLLFVERYGDRPQMLVLSLMLITAAISMWLSNTATVLVMLPIAFSVLAEVQSRRDDDHDRRLGRATLIGIAYAATIGGTASPVGTPANQTFMDQHPAFGFLDWMRVGVPYAGLMVVAAWAMLARVAFPLDRTRARTLHARPATHRADLGPISRAEWRMLIVAATTALLWIFREPIGGWGWLPWLASVRIVPPAAAGGDWISDGTVAMAMALACFLIPTGRDAGTRLLEWRMTQRVPWAVLFLFGGAMALAAGVETSGLGDAAGRWFGVAMASAEWPLLQTLAAVVAAITATQLTPSNLSTSAMLLPALSAGTAAAVPILFAATIAASTDFMFPWSTPPNAIVYAAGRLHVRHMLRAGIWLTLISALLNALLIHLFV